MKRASPTHGGRWLAQTNYDALMTHHTTENSHPSFISYVMSIIYILRKKYHIHRSQNLSSSAVRADALALHGARTSAGTVMTTKLHMAFHNFWLLMILNLFSLTRWHHSKWLMRFDKIYPNPLRVNYRFLAIWCDYAKEAHQHRC